MQFIAREFGRYFYARGVELGFAKLLRK